MTNPPDIPRPAIALIVAMGRNRVIGAGGGLPWRMPSDLKTFRRLTIGKPVLMGRTTFQSIGKPLDGRDNIVVSRDSAFRPSGVEVFPTIEAALERAKALASASGAAEIMVIGGAQIYAATLGVADRIYLSEIDASPEGDALFPPLDAAIWRESTRTPIETGARDEFRAELVVLERVDGRGSLHDATA